MKQSRKNTNKSSALFNMCLLPELIYSGIVVLTVYNSYAYCITALCTPGSCQPGTPSQCYAYNASCWIRKGIRGVTSVANGHGYTNISVFFSRNCPQMAQVPIGPKVQKPEKLRSPKAQKFIYICIYTLRIHQSKISNAHPADDDNWIAVG